MNKTKVNKSAYSVLLGLLLLAAPAAVQAQFIYTTNNGAITLAGYNGTGGAVVIPNFVTSIGDFAFYNCFFLTNLTMGNGVLSIGQDAFLACSSLTSLTIPGSVTSIGEEAFDECSGLTSVTIGNGVTSIGIFAFYNCTRLSSVFFMGTAPAVDGTAFEVGYTTVYYLPGTTGWNVFAAATGIPAVMLNPPPGTMVGDGFLIEISSGTSPLASYGYSILLVGDSGNSWNLIGIYNVQDDSGTYTYTNAGPYATVIMNDATETDNIRLTFTSPTQGTFFSDITYPPAYSGLTQSGNFVAATGTALNSIAGLNVLCSVANGYAPFAASGSYTIVFATSGNTYVMKSSTGVRTSSGRYSYSVVNRSTAAIQITDSVAGSFTVYVGFSNQLSGGYAITQSSTGGFQIGSFSISGTTPPVQAGSLQVTITPAGAITAGAQWQVDGGILLNSGAASDLPVGNHTVSFNSVNGWTAPDNQTIAIKAKMVTKVKGTYTFDGAGVYNGLFMQADAAEEANSVALPSSGFFTATVTGNGGYSGKIQQAGKTYPFSGTFNVGSINTSGPPAFDVVADFSTSANPNGVWSYGWSTAPGEPFQLATKPFPQGGIAGAFGWDNGLPLPDSCWIAKDFDSIATIGTVVYNPDTLHMDPQSYEVMARFTVPSNGSYQVSGLFRLEDTGPHAHDLTILVNGNTTNFHVFTSGGTYNSEYPFNFATALTQGETLDFIVGCRNGDYYDLGTGLKASIATADLTGSASTLVPRSGLAPLSLHLQLDSSGGGILTGYIVDGSWTASLTAELAAKGSASAEYTALVLPAGTPPGYGYILITNHGGAATLSVTLADGTSFSQNVPLSGAGDLPVYGNLYGSTGLLLGWLGLESGSPTGNLTWIKPTSRSTALYTNGFTNLSVVQGSLWTNPLPHTAAIDLPSGQLDISDGSLRSPLSFNVAVSNNNALVKLPGSPTNSLTGSINAKTGLLTATFGNGAGKATTAAKGAVLQNVTNAAGFFFGKTNAGSMVLQP